MKKSETLKVAFYIRVSSEEQAENPEGSIKNQEERLRLSLKLKNMDARFGDCVGIYVDRALSGKDTNRPELQKLLAAIERGEVTLVMVTELSRLTRAMRDFTTIKDLMDRAHCGLLSLRENFDSTTAAGEMAMYLMATMAQFERKQVSERVGANFLARAQRGLYNGGRVPVGYQLIPEKRGYLAIDSEGAPAVRKAFEFFLEEGSLSRAAKELNKAGFRFKSNSVGGRGNKPSKGYFTFQNVHDVLTNPAYIGVKRFKQKGEWKQTQAVWEPLVDAEVFERVQALLKKNYCRGRPHEKLRYPFLLAGMSSCFECKERLLGKSAHGNGGKIPYYDHASLHRRYQCRSEKPHRCSPVRVQAKKIEPLVWEKVTELFRDPRLAKSIIEAAKKLYAVEKRDAEDNPTQTRLATVGRKLETLAERLSELPRGVSAEPIYTQMKKLDAEKGELETRLQAHQLKQAHPKIPAHFNSYTALLQGLGRIAARAELAEDRVRILKALVHQVEVKHDGIRVHFYAGEQEIRRAKDGPRMGLIGSENFSTIAGSKSLLNGWGTRESEPLAKY